MKQDKPLTAGERKFLEKMLGKQVNRPQQQGPVANPLY